MKSSGFRRVFGLFFGNFHSGQRNCKVLIHFIAFMPMKHSIVIKKLEFKKVLDVFDEIIIQDKEIARLEMDFDQTISTNTRKLLKILQCYNEYEFKV